MPGQQCVNSLDFGVSQGILYARTHAARMRNNVNTREVPSGSEDLDQPVFEWTIPGADTVDYDLGTAINADPANCRFFVNVAGIYHISASYGDNEFQTNDGAKLYLTAYVDGASVIRGDAYKVGGQKAWPSLAGDVYIPAGGQVRFSYAVGYCDPPPPPDPPICGRGNHFLMPDARNFFAIHLVGRDVD
jgi:hypothetical protein